MRTGAVRAIPDATAFMDPVPVAPPECFQGPGLEVDELVRAETDRLLTVGSPAGADDVRARFTRELRHHRPDGTGPAVDDDALACLKAAVVEQSLPRGQARDWQART